MYESVTVYCCQAYGDYTLYRQLEEHVVNLSDTSRLTVLDFCDILASLETNKVNWHKYAFIVFSDFALTDCSIILKVKVWLITR